MIGNKKVRDVQFFQEAGAQFDDLEYRRGRALNDYEEIEAEQRERQ